MGTIGNIKNIYFSAFENCKPEILVVLLKAYAVFCLLLLSITLYAFVYRAFTGFNF